jgi:hypothetical protein
MWEISQPWKQLTYVFNAMENGDFVMWSPKVKLRVVDSVPESLEERFYSGWVCPHTKIFMFWGNLFVLITSNTQNKHIT